MKVSDLLEAVDDPLVVSMLKKLLKQGVPVLFFVRNYRNTYNDIEGAKITNVEVHTTPSGRPFAEIFYKRADNGTPDSNMVVGKNLSRLKLAKAEDGWELRYEVR